MYKFRRLLLTFIFTAVLLLQGCGFAEKAKTLKDDVINITFEQLAWQLENSLNEQFPGVQLNTPQILDSSGRVNWKAFKQSELGNYTFYQIGNFEFNSVLTGDGVFTVQRVNHATGDTYTYAQFKVDRVNGKFKVKAK